MSEVTELDGSINEGSGKTQSKKSRPTDRRATASFRKIHGDFIKGVNIIILYLVYEEHFCWTLLQFGELTSKRF
jgi:hypothetical protein